MRNIVLYFFLAYLISWTIWLPLILPEYGIHVLPVLPKYHHYLGSFGPFLAALIMHMVTNGKTGVTVLLKRLVQWRVPFQWYLIVLVAPVLLVVVAGYAAEIFTGEEFTMIGFSTNAEFPEFGPIGYFLFNLLTFGIGEETGWRGYALPMLQKKFTALTSTLILSVFWACWHIPAFLYRPLYSQMDIAGISGFFMSMVMGSILLTWLYNSTRGSLLIVSVFHAMVELIFISKNITPQISMYEGVAFTIAAVLVIIMTKPRNLSFTNRMQNLNSQNEVSIPRK